MTRPAVAPFGSWKSPVTSDLIVSETVTLSEPCIFGSDFFWLESRPTQAGRSVVVRRTPDGGTFDLFPAPFNARTRVHEYGGGAWCVVGDGVVFSNFEDQRLYSVPLSRPQAPVALTPARPFFFADMIFDSRRNRLVCVREDHSASDQEAVNAIVSVSLTDGGSRVLVDGHGFFSSCRLSPDGDQLAWLSWDHPNMPWDGTELWTASVNPDGSLSHVRKVAGGPDESIYQPEWSPEGVLHFVSDRTGWWNLYALLDGEVRPLCPLEAEFGLPAWTFGSSTYAFTGPHSIVCNYMRNGSGQLARLDTRSARLTDIDCPYSPTRWLRADSRRMLFVGASGVSPTAVVLLDLDSASHHVLRPSSNVQLDRAWVSVAQHVSFPTTDNLSTHGLYFPPVNPDFRAPDGELPPLIVHVHGGPTSSASAAFSLTNLFWTSRGFALLDLNYRGSTGYGREYRKRLDGNWGVADVDDAVNGALFLVNTGKADTRRLAISGGSAGGFTTLAALTFRRTFKAGASHYGVSDLAALVHDTHKFESRYLDRLVGPWPECKDMYQARSPLFHAKDISCPVIFFQGLEDKIVPPNQAEMMIRELHRTGSPVAAIFFPGEQHGFRRAQNIKRSLDAELFFYGKVFGFTPADHIEPVTIENL